MMHFSMWWCFMDVQLIKKGSTSDARQDLSAVALVTNYVLIELWHAGHILRGEAGLGP